MLEVLSLTKIFKSNKNEEKIALDNVSFKLPDKGFSFIVGKSGSGKTTLLSLIGGLDDITSGKIIYNGNKLSEMKHNEFDIYRNNEVGFIFQDYHLLEELTIFDNIKMMLDFKNIKDDNRIYDALNSVGLKGYEKRYPKELSGGEKQRVAIARVIVKNPSIILADEPTGNLDQKTTKQILDLLKNISKEKLVLIVSHNKYDAYEYGDYILKLDDGKIKEKYIKNNSGEDNFRIEDGIFYISKNRHITNQEVNKIKEIIKVQKIRDIRQNKTKFIKYNEEVLEKNVKFNDKLEHITLKNSLKYSFKFFKTEIFKSLIISLVLALIISVATLCGLISNINKDEIRLNYLKHSNYSDFMLIQNEDNLFNNLKDEMCIEIKDKLNPKYIYKGYNPVNNRLNLGFKGFEEMYATKKTLVYVVDEPFLVRHFGMNNKIDFIYKREVEQKDGFYVTDCFIDNLNRYKTSNEEFKGIVENGYDSLYAKFKVNGIIKTHIYEKYDDILAKVDRFDVSNNKNLTNDEINRFISYMNEFYLYHNSFYTFNNNFYNDVIDELALVHVGLPIAKHDNKVHDLYSAMFVAEEFPGGLDLKNDEIVLSQSDYYKIFGKIIDVNSSRPTMLDEKIELKVDFYDRNDYRLTNKLATKVFKVVGVFNNYNICNRETIKDIKKEFNSASNLFIEEVSDIETLNKINKKYGTKFTFIEETHIEKIDILVSSLRNFFIFVLIVLIIAIILLTCLYFIKNFSHNLFEIGVMKSLGARDMDIIHMMTVDFIVTFIVTILIFNIMEIPLVSFSNNVLFEGIKKVSSLGVLNSEVEILNINMLKLTFINIIIFIIFFLAFILQFVRIKKLKPVNIIKAKE